VAFARDIMSDAEDAPTSFCCGALSEQQANNVRGKIAVCDRGSCLFVTKSKIVQEHGAVGLIVVDYNEDGVRMGSTVPVDEIVIPSVSVRNSYGQLLKLVSEQTPVTVKLASFVCDDNTFSTQPGVCGAPAPTPANLVPNGTPVTRTPTPQSPTSGQPTRQPRTLRPTGEPTALVPPIQPSPDTKTQQLVVTVKENSNDLDVNRFMKDLNNYFGWGEGTASLIFVAPHQTYPAEQTEVVVAVSDGPYLSADQAILLAETKFSASGQPFMPSGVQLLQLSNSVSATDCGINVEECVSSDFTRAVLNNCECETSLTGLGVFVYIFLPIVIILAIIVLVCFMFPMCPLYKGNNKQMFGGVRSDDYGEGNEDNFDDIEGGGESTGFVMKGNRKNTADEQKLIMADTGRSSEVSHSRTSHYETADVALVSLHTKPEDTNPEGDTLQSAGEDSSSDDESKEDTV